MRLSNHIYRSSRKYGFPANIYTAILMQESGYRVGAINESCGKLSITDVGAVCVKQDFGIAQINYKTVDSYEFDAEKLLTDEKYSVDAGAKVLGYFYRKYSKKEYDWWVRYNVGTRPKGSVKTLWDQYKQLVSRYL